MSEWFSRTMKKSDKKFSIPLGRRSPRWALWAKMLIPCRSGIPYLFRLRIIQTPWFGVYLHDIFEPDDQDPHNHPWSFVSVVLRGSYVELVYPHPSDAYHWSGYTVKVHGRWSVHRMGQHSAHRIIRTSPKLKTLIFVGPRRKGSEWGFFVRGRYVHYEQYAKRTHNYDKYLEEQDVHV